MRLQYINSLGFASLTRVENAITKFYAYKLIKLSLDSDHGYLISCIEC